jgi:hypothetical protein
LEWNFNKDLVLYPRDNLELCLSVSNNKMGRKLWQQLVQLDIFTLATSVKQNFLRKYCRLENFQFQSTCNLIKCIQADVEGDLATFNSTETLTSI